MAEPSSGDFEPYALFDVAAYAARVRAMLGTCGSVPGGTRRAYLPDDPLKVSE
ncbi:hypothetical protein [Streptomyces koyangensis]|uniref:hypothetical protein n=1 Tax=Streptomyces koyangensis TaxID=188770 RepID=UPI00216B4D5C|nr:hypothetical protein [Streptomyces koyangensis]